jgi:hypothetical protein
LDSKRNWIRDGEGDSKRPIATIIFKKFWYFLQVTLLSKWPNPYKQENFLNSVAFQRPKLCDERPLRLNLPGKYLIRDPIKKFTLRIFSSVSLWFLSLLRYPSFKIMVERR